MKSRILIITIVLLLVPILVGATPVNLAIKIGAGCPFKQGPKLERCNPTLIHSNLNPSDLGIVALPLSSTLTAFPSDQVEGVNAVLSLNVLTAFPLRC